MWESRRIKTGIMSHDFSQIAEIVDVPPSCDFLVLHVFKKLFDSSVSMHLESYSFGEQLHVL